MIDGSALNALAIFPLPEAVLFPGTLLPLHVFEPRYRAMTEAVVGSGRIMAVVRLRPGYELDYEGRPPVYDVAGVGYVVRADRLEDGRWNIMLRGVGRVHIDAELPPAEPWRQVRARLLVDTHSERPADVSGAHETLVAICDRIADTLPAEGGTGLRQLVRALPSPGGCADAVAAAILRDPDERQLLLEMLDPVERLERLIEAASALLVRLDRKRTLN